MPVKPVKEENLSQAAPMPLTRTALK